MTYRVDFAADVYKQLRGLTAGQRALVFEAIEKQLRHEPFVETRNRKPLRPNPIASWELRVREIRIFYDVVSEEHDRVRILAIGTKEGNIVLIGGEEIPL